MTKVHPMTLITTEIHHHDDRTRAVIVFGADRRISKADGTYGDTRRKVLAIERLNAGIGYFGLAQVPKDSRQQFMDDWLRAFIRSNTSPTLPEFASALAAQLNSAIPNVTRQECISGFHVAGFDEAAKPEFWFVRNVDDDRTTITGSYAAREDFQRQHAAETGQYGWSYRNGDIRVHAAAWEELDKAFIGLMKLPDFRSVSKPEDYAKWVKFKLSVVAHFYKHYSTKPVIGAPIDTFVLVP
jgi:hypothetical protein